MKREEKIRLLNESAAAAKTCAENLRALADEVGAVIALAMLAQDAEGLADSLSSKDDA